MQLFFLSLVLLSISPCIHSQVTLGQDSSVRLRPSETLRLTCKVSGFSLTATGYTVSWIRQSTGKGLEWLCLVYWDDDKRYSNSLKSRLTISRDVSKSEVYLEMSGMETKDTGRYYCILSQVTLGQDSSVRLRPSETLRLTCKVSGFSLTEDEYDVSWIRQPTGKGLEWLCLIYWEDDKAYSNSLKSRLTISRDVSKSEVYLEMSGMETKDTGRYYCAGETQHAKSMGNLYNYQFHDDWALLK
ncbi:uncharacterized protein [Anolis sagrei]|uniref:uncharacterized protein n=1 Tax=Anolis sagrei TaxID=38937 RepID=UPI00351F84E3